MQTQGKIRGRLVRSSALLVLSGCIALTVQAGQPAEQLCQALKQHDAWLDAAVATERRWGLPLHVSLAELNLIIGTEASAYIQPRDNDWEQYRLATEHWEAELNQIATALDFLGWHAQLAVQRNQLTLNDAGALYLAYQLGHGGYQRYLGAPDPRLTQDAQQVEQRAVQFQRALQSCSDIRQRAGRFFRWPW